VKQTIGRRSGSVGAGTGGRHHDRWWSLRTGSDGRWRGGSHGGMGIVVVSRRWRLPVTGCASSVDRS
jgi:hypothetical protein